MTWLDTSTRPSWSLPEELRKNHKPIVIDSLSWLVNINDEGITLSQSSERNEECKLADSTVIPWGVVQELTER